MIVGLLDRIPKQNALFSPKSLKVVRLLAQAADQINHLRIIDMLAEIRPEQCQKAARPKLPIDDDCSYIRIKEHVTQQVFLRALQPYREHIRQSGIPEPQCPISVEHTP